MPETVTPGLQVRVAKSHAGMSKQAARIIVAELKKKPDLLLCASAGGTPGETYQFLAQEFARRSGLFARLSVIQIDEWAGLPRGSSASCEADLRLKLISPLQIRAGRFAGFRSDADEPAAECRRISQWLESRGPIDICILGLGLNGHVAMNEPAAASNPSAHVAKLAAISRKHGMLRDLARKPSYGMTLGLGEILQSRKILLLVSGKNKRAALKHLMRPEVTSRFPASFLWLHSDATVLCDEEAANGLTI
jgi:galactosamine-6-phosphate isomerase